MIKMIKYFWYLDKLHDKDTLDEILNAKKTNQPIKKILKAQSTIYKESNEAAIRVEEFKKEIKTRKSIQPRNVDASCICVIS